MLGPGRRETQGHKAGQKQSIDFGAFFFSRLRLIFVVFSGKRIFLVVAFGTRGIAVALNSFIPLLVEIFEVYEDKLVVYLSGPF